MKLNQRIPVGSKVSFIYRDSKIEGILHHRNAEGKNVVFVKRNEYSNLTDKFLLADNEITK